MRMPRPSGARLEGDGRAARARVAVALELCVIRTVPMNHSAGPSRDGSKSAPSVHFQVSTFVCIYTIGDIYN